MAVAVLWPARRESSVPTPSATRPAPIPSVGTKDLSTLLSRLLEDRRVKVEPARGSGGDLARGPGGDLARGPGGARGAGLDLLVRAPKGRSLFALQAAVARAAPLWGVTLAPGHALRLPNGEPAVDLVCTRGTERVHLRMVQSLPAARPRIALVIDDFGYPSHELMEGFLRLGIPFTPSVLPGYPRSQESARRLLQAGHAPLLHLPMDPKDQEHNDPGPGIVRSTMRPAEIHGIVTGHLAALDGVVGVSQHMGSRGSEEPGVVAPALDALAGRDLVFLDSATSPRSILPAEAAARGVRCLTADMFLDGDPHPSPATMAARMLQARELAQEAGSAIVIAHARKGTLQFLESISDSLPTWDCRFVTLGELLR